MQNWKALDKNIGSSDNIVTSEWLFLLLLNINQAIFFSLQIMVLFNILTLNQNHVTLKSNRDISLRATTMSSLDYFQANSLLDIELSLKF